MQIRLLTTSFTRLGLSACLSLVLTAAAPPGYAGGIPREAGVWIDDSGEGAVKIEPCGNKLCGHIVWLENLVNDKGETLMDRHNPDPNMHTRLICGLPVLGQLEAQPDGTFDNGWVYDPKDGNAYSAAIQVNGPDKLSVTGYKGIKLLGKTMTWTRAKIELPSCAAPAISAPVEAKAAIGGGTTATALPAAAGAAAAARSAASANAPASKKAGVAEVLPWSNAKPAAKTAGASTKPAVADVKPAAKKPKPPVEVTQQPLEPASQ